MSENIKGLVVGIDLGTTNSCVSILQNGKPVVIHNSEGKNTTPSIISYKSKEERLVGEPAKRRSITDPKNTLYRTKSFMGCTFEEALEQTKDIPMPFKIVKSKQGGASFSLDVGVVVSPSEAGAAILQHLKEIAEKYCGQKVENAVITVPAYFNDQQRQATKDAGQIAGLNVLRIINEPTAAALAYGLDKAQNKEETIAVYDLGGGTFDVSILKISDGVFEVVSTNGDTHLGGEDFDNSLVKFIAGEFKKETGIDLIKENNKEAIQRLKEAAEKAKISLSSQQSTEVSLPFITANADGAKHLNVAISRAKFEELIWPDLDKTEKCCKLAIKDAKIDKNSISKILLVGGSTRIPAVKELVKKIFGKEPSCDLNPDEVVADGAAVQAGILKGDVKDVLLLDVIPLSLGIETLGGVMTKLVEKNTTIPLRKSQTFSTAADNQTSVSIIVFQGEREIAKDNKLLGQFDLHGIPTAPRGVPQVEVSFDVDSNGILHVKAKEKNTGKEQSITIQGSSGLSKEEVEKMTKEAEQHAEADKSRKQLIELKNNSESLVYTAEKTLKDTTNLPEDLKKTIEEKIQHLKTILQGEETSAIQSAYDDLSGELSKVYEHTSKNAAQENGQTSDNQQSEEKSQ